MSKPKSLLGKQGENAACRYLRRRGLTLLARNYMTRLGEIDLIMQDHAILVFVEVRLRNRPDILSGAESVTPLKQRRLIRTAHHYLQSHWTAQLPTCRFDVIDLQNRWCRFKVQWMKDAFRLSEE